MKVAPLKGSLQQFSDAAASLLSLDIGTFGIDDESPKS